MNMQATNNVSGAMAGTGMTQTGPLYSSLGESPTVGNSSLAGMGGMSQGLAQYGGKAGGGILSMSELYRQASLPAMNSLVESATAQTNGTVSVTPSTLITDGPPP